MDQLDRRDFLKLGALAAIGCASIPKIETLPGAENLDSTSDVEDFKRKLGQQLRPIWRWDDDRWSRVQMSELKKGDKYATEVYDDDLQPIGIQFFQAVENPSYIGVCLGISGMSIKESEIHNVPWMRIGNRQLLSPFGADNESS